MKKSSGKVIDSIKPVSSAKVRFGILLWVISYLPIPVVIVGILHNSGKLTDPKQSSTFIAVMWGIQLLIGWIGLFVAGKEAIGLVRKQGMKKLPKNLWYVVIGRPIPEPE
jgi:hypothetical protein